MIDAWPIDTDGMLRLPSGRLVRGRGLRHPMPPGPTPDFGVYLLGKPPAGVFWEQSLWEHRWVRWPDFWLPSDESAFRSALTEAWKRSDTERVEFACGGGRGRTGTALACLAIVDGVPAAEAVDFVRRNYDRGAVETPWQKRFVRRFGG